MTSTSTPRQVVRSLGAGLARLARYPAHGPRLGAGVLPALEPPGQPWVVLSLAHFHAPLYIFYKESRRKYTRWRTNDFTARGYHRPRAPPSSAPSATASGRPTFRGGRRTAPTSGSPLARPPVQPAASGPPPPPPPPPPISSSLKFTGLTRISKDLIGIFSQTSGPTCEFWVSPVNFTFRTPNPQVAGLREGASVRQPWPAREQCEWAFPHSHGGIAGGAPASLQPSPQPPTWKASPLQTP
jgi:hypothetical protein